MQYYFWIGCKILKIYFMLKTTTLFCAIPSFTLARKQRNNLFLTYRVLFMFIKQTINYDILSKILEYLTS